MKTKSNIFTKSLLLLLLGLTAKGFAGGNADFKLSSGEATTRANLNLPYFTITAMNIVKDGKTEHNALRTTFETDFLKGKGYVTARVDKKRNDQGDFENSYVISPAFAKGAFYIEPLWTTFDKNFDVTEVDPFIQVNTKVASMDVQTALLYAAPLKDECSQAFYVAVNNDKIGVGAGKYFDGSYAVQIGGPIKEDLGARGAVKVDPESGDWSLSGCVAQNPSSSVGVNWPELYGDYLIIGRGKENMPYFTATGNNSKDGLATKVKVNGNKSKIESVLYELGYNTGDLALTIGQEHDFVDGGSTAKLSATYKLDDKVTIEGSIDDDADISFYAKYEW